MSYQQILEESKHIQSKLQFIDAQLAQLPEGSIFCVQNGKYPKWYQRINNKQVYLSKNKHFLAEGLAYKKYLSYLKEDLQNEQTAINAYLKYHSSDIGKAQQLLIDKPEYMNLLTDSFQPVSQKLTEWMYQPYERKECNPEHLPLKATSGNYVRSKSELIIDLSLFTNKIPFRYENALQLGQRTIYPDFTIRHPKTGKFFYWEHFGMMDNPVYAQKVFSKLQLYTSHGIIPSIQLITTYETKEAPLNAELVQKIINHYFC